MNPYRPSEDSLAPAFICTACMVGVAGVILVAIINALLG